MVVSLEDRYPNAQRFKFGDGQEMCDRLLALVIAGEKTATCGALRDFGGEDKPVVGRRDIVENWAGEPKAVIETVEVVEQPFCDVTEDFALAEGDGSFANWRTVHRDYFARNGGWEPDMMLVCERFRLVEVLDG